MIRHQANSGRWMAAEEAYVDSAISCFFLGILDDCHGLTLRQYIAWKLHCDEMRVTKKLRETKVLAGRRFIAQNFNRKCFSPKTEPPTAAEMELLTTLKLAYSQFEVALARKQTRKWTDIATTETPPPAATPRHDAIRSLLNGASDDDDEDSDHHGCEEELVVDLEALSINQEQ
ncbi:Aste57867_24888 [Aphanomyces stellatus]|uniref:Aste57867_24888 protein n=1 Tax=Aphanomyces stellatus TaxID=120398 RepID=A0A485LRP9_9STRA|nr:hypothetical protein As57867_024810 [Aphanomyces stellatus]VFU01522.1 Aste57867_24888 [Aphanomyces stellatus]